MDGAARRNGTAPGGPAPAGTTVLGAAAPASVVLAAAFLAAAGLLVPPARAAEGLMSDAPLPAVASVNACFSDTIRVTGYVLARGEVYLGFNLDGYRIADILVKEDDTVAADQELIRFARLGAEDPAGVTAAMRGFPPSITLKAPAAGTIGRVTTRAGALTRAQPEPLLRIVTDPAPDLLVEVPSLYVSRIKAGAKARILSEDGGEIAGTVRVPATDVDPATQFGRARIGFAAGARLRPGAFARALIDTGRSCGVAVPRTAILRQNDTTSVQVLRDGKPETRRVRVGLSSEDLIEIKNGVALGEAVVANAGKAF